MVNVLFLYNQTQTYTNTVFEHVNSFSQYSRNKFYFAHHDQYSPLHVDLSRFEVVCLHYSVRLPFDQIASTTINELASYPGLKVLFIQDEYDHTHRAWHWIKKLGFKLVFTVAPAESIARVYPPEEFPRVRFVSNLTGYVPEGLHCAVDAPPPSRRELIIGYRGRPLPIRYGQLGQEKVGIGQLVKKYCDSKGIRNDIAWTEEARIYGPKWYDFMVACRAMLGSESGSNVFDWDGTLTSRIQAFLSSQSEATEEDVYNAIVKQQELAGLMNQVSPRLFEAVASRTVLVLFEGNYSGVVYPDVHYIPLKKDGSNLKEVFEQLQDGKLVDEVTNRAYQDIIASGKYSYQSFVRMVDEQIMLAVESLNLSLLPNSRVPRSLTAENTPTSLTTCPIRALPPLTRKVSGSREKLTNLAYRAWRFTPERVRRKLRPILKKLLVIG